MTKIQNNFEKTKQAYIAWLNTLPWTFFLTGSTRYELTLKSNRRLIDRWYNGFLVEPCRSNNYTPYFHPGIKTKSSCLFWVSEPFELKDGCHGHGLLYLPGYDPDRDRAIYTKLIDHWQLVTGNGGRDRDTWNALNLSLYNPKRGGGGYCSKYIMKDGADYDIFFYHSLNIEQVAS